MVRTHVKMVLVLAVTALAPRATAQGGGDFEGFARDLLSTLVPDRDDPDALFRAALAAGRGQKDSPVAEIALARAESVGGQIADPEAAIDSLSGLLDEGLHPLAEARARALRALLLRRIGRRDEAEVLELQQAFARSMLVVGPFGDSGDDFLDVFFPPEGALPALEEELPGRFGPVRLRKVERSPRNRTLSFLDSEQPRTGCFYGLHQVRAAEDTLAWAEVQCEGSFKLFLNGTLRARISRTARPEATRQYVPLVLRAGVNHVLIKTALAGQHDVVLRYVDARGASHGGVEEIPAESISPRASGPTPDMPQPTFRDGVDRLLQAAAAEGAAPALRIAAALAAMDRGDRLAGLELLLPLRDQPPEDPLLRLALAEGLLRASELPRELREATAREWIESLATAESGSHHLLLRRAGFLRNDDRAEDALRLLQAEVDAGRAGPRIFAELAGLLDELQFTTQRQQLRQLWMQTRPSDVQPVLDLARERELNGDRPGAMRLLEEYTSRRPGDPRTQREVLRLALELDDAERADAALAAILAADDPDRPGSLILRARAASRLGRDQEALELYRRFSQNPDAGPTGLREAGEFFLRLGQDQQALGPLAASLGRDPSQHDLRRLLQRLRGTIEDQGIARYRRDLDAVAAAFEAGEAERGSPSSLVFDQMIVRMYEDGSSVEETHQLRRINDLAGVQAHEQADAVAQASEVLDLRTIGTDGRDYVPTRVAESFSMPRLQPGAFVVTAYRNYTTAAGARPWRGPSFVFQSTDEPFLESELVLILPAAAQGEFRSRNFDGSYTREDLPDGTTAHIFRKSGVPRLVPERLSPPLDEVVPYVTFGEDGELDATARLQAAGLERAVLVTPDVQRIADRLCTGIEDPEQRLQILHRYVHDRVVDGRGSRSATEILLRGQGERFFALASLARAAGLDVELALTTQAREELLPGLRSLFDGELPFVIPAARLRLGDQTTWAFAGDPRHQPLGAIRAELQGGPVLLLGSTPARLERIPADGGETADLGWEFVGDLVLDADGQAIWEMTASLRGAQGLEFAEQIRNLQTERQGQVARSLSGQLFAGWTVRRAQLGDLSPGRGLSLRAQLTRPGALSPAGDRFVMPLPIPPSDLFSSFGGREERLLPMRLASINRNVWRLRIDPGPAFRIASLPPGATAVHDLLDYQLRLERDGDGVLIERSAIQRPGELPPSRVGEWLRLLRHLDQAESGTLGLVRR